MDAPFRTSSIDIADRLRLREWARELDVSEYALRHAIDLVGPSAAAVRAYLRRR